jgi:hypothetical protein
MVEKGIFAVITGDVIGSSAYATGQTPTAKIIREIEHQLLPYFRREIFAGVDVFRGDSWQMVVQDPIRSLRIALFFRALMISGRGLIVADSRLSIGFGQITYLPESNISSGDGQAFRLSGAGLDKCKKDQLMCLNFPQEDLSSLPGSLNMIVRLVDLQVQRWTSRQADAVAGALVGLNQKKIATDWFPNPVSQQAISQHLESAGWDPIEEAVEYFEAILPSALNV